MANSILTINQITGEDLEHYTVLKLLHEVIGKTNELVGSTNGVYEILTYLLNDGLSEEVVETLNKWLSDGTLADLITEEVLGNINNRLDKLEEIIINVKEYGVVGDGITDDSLALQTLLDSISWIDKNTSIPTNSLTINFPFGIYKVNQPLTIKAPGIFEFNNSTLMAGDVVTSVLTSENNVQIPNVIIRNLIIDGKGIARKGLIIKDLYRGKIENITVYACVENCIYATNQGSSGILEFELDGGLCLGGINPYAGGYTTTNDCIGFQINTTDCLIKNLYTRDFKVHIYNQAGINFYDHCHGWNQYPQIMANSVHMKVGWDISCVGCYSDTIKYAFDFVGDARANITNHQVFVNKTFYSVDDYGPLYLFKTTGTKGNKVTFVNSRFDNNGLSAKISDQSHPLIFEFIGCTNSFSSGDYVVSEKSYPQPDVTGNITIWAWSCIKQSQKKTILRIYGEIPASNGAATVLALTMPEGTYNKYYETYIPVYIEDKVTYKGTITMGRITTSGQLQIKMNALPFDIANDITVNINAEYYITY